MAQKTVLTKKEVIIVLGCMAFITLNLMAAGGNTRRHAKFIVCQANLRQWGQIFTLFAQDNQGNFPQGIGSDSVSSSEAYWLGAMLPYYQDQKTLLCPSTKKVDRPPTSWPEPHGSTFESWGPFPPSTGDNWWDHFATGSYGFNDWCANPPAGSFYWGLPIANVFRKMNAEGGDNIPLLLDSAYVDGAPDDNDIPPSYPDNFDAASWNTNAMRLFCMDRHNGGINGVFVDTSVRKINPKELWTLKWHKNFDTNNQWTLPGAIWPEWMQQY